MTTSLDCSEELSQTTDTQLWRMLAGAEACAPGFFAAAQEELRRRRLAPRQISSLAAPTPTQASAAVEPANQSLNWPLRLLIVVTSISLLGTLLAAQYEDQGQTRKAEECWMTLIIGVVGWCVAIFLICLL